MLGDEAGLQALSTALLVIAVAVIVINEAADGGVALAAPRDSVMPQNG
jgi:hypothetical protein